MSLCFPASQIQEVVLDDKPDPQPRVTVNFMGLTGPLGVLPHHYTELLMQRAWAKDHTLRDFLDIFNHRYISLFYRAWEKYRFPVAYERGRDDRFTFYLSALIGMATGGLQGRLAVDDQGLLLYAGLFNQQPHSASALESMLRDYFGCLVEVIQFQGRWVRLGAENQTRLGVQNHVLGGNAVCGEQTWDRQSLFRIRVGPLRLATFLDFLPGARAYSQIMQLTRLFSGMEYDFEVQLVLKAGEVPACQLVSKGPGGAYLGWSSWLKTREFRHDADNTILRCNN
jgi:type VI secretion system protein ImpH